MNERWAVTEARLWLLAHDAAVARDGHADDRRATLRMTCAEYLVCRNRCAALVRPPDQSEEPD